MLQIAALREQQELVLLQFEEKETFNSQRFRSIRCDYHQLVSITSSLIFPKSERILIFNHFETGSSSFVSTKIVVKAEEKQTKKF